jgi:LuxR family maltose regulon positive regulatory protein
MSRIREAQGDLEGAIGLLIEAEGVDLRTPLPRARPIAAMLARVRIAQGRITDAAAWATERGLTPGDDLSYMREFEHVTLARILIARQRADGSTRHRDDALNILSRLTTAAETGGRIGSVIETLMLQALVHQIGGDLRAAREPLERSLSLAEPEGYLRVFIDEGSSMRDLLRHGVTRGFASQYAKHVLASFDEPPPVAVRTPVATSSALLTARELVILRLIAAGMRNQDIASHLSISPATVKRHIANTYGKLNARHRTEALVRASELKLL